MPKKFDRLEKKIEKEYIKKAKVEKKHGISDLLLPELY